MCDREQQQAEGEAHDRLLLARLPALQHHLQLQSLSSSLALCGGAGGRGSRAPATRRRLPARSSSSLSCSSRASAVSTSSDVGTTEAVVMRAKEAEEELVVRAVEAGEEWEVEVAMAALRQATRENASRRQALCAPRSAACCSPRATPARRAPTPPRPSPISCSSRRTGSPSSARAPCRRSSRCSPPAPPPRRRPASTRPARCSASPCTRATAPPSARCRRCSRSSPPATTPPAPAATPAWRCTTSRSPRSTNPSSRAPFRRFHGWVSLLAACRVHGFREAAAADDPRLRVHGFSWHEAEDLLQASGFDPVQLFRMRHHHILRFHLLLGVQNWDQSLIWLLYFLNQKSLIWLPWMALPWTDRWPKGHDFTIMAVTKITLAGSWKLHLIIKSALDRQEASVLQLDYRCKNPRVPHLQISASHGSQTFLCHPQLL